MATNKLSYRDNPKLKRVGVQVQWTREQIEEYQKCATDYLYFAKYVTIISLDKGIIPFEMYDFQKDMIKTFDENRFVIVKCPRQVGKTTTAIHIFFGQFYLNLHKILLFLLTKVKLQTIF